MTDIDFNPETVLGLKFNDMAGVISSLDEKQLKTIIDFEVNGKKRKYVIKRAFERYSGLRNSRELEELLKNVRGCNGRHRNKENKK